MSAPGTISRAVRARRLRSAATALGGLLVAMAALGQEAARDAAAPRADPAAHADKARDAGRWDLPRLFYEPRQRRSLDAQDRALHLGLNAAGTAPTGPRFDGWVAGPAGTHAWVSGAPYVADRNGRLHPAPERALEPGTDDMENAQAQLDRGRGVLVVRRETEGNLHLRVGESESPLDAPPDAPAPAAPEHH